MKSPLPPQPMAQRLEQTQTMRQQQTLAPLQVQYVRMLEMTEPELEEEVRRAVDENPALEVAADDCGDVGTGEHDDYDMQLGDYRNEEEVPSGHMALVRSQRRGGESATTAAGYGETMMESLMRQLGEGRSLSAQQRRIARAIIGNIDSNGYMARRPAMIAADMSVASGEEVEPEDVAAVWEMVRGLDPAGIGARDLCDALLLQLERRGESRARSVAQRMIGEEFELFKSMRFDRMKRKLKVSDEELEGALELIRTLNPKPGGEFTGNEIESRLNEITPDFQVDVDGDGRVSVVLMNSLPQLTVEQSFAQDAQMGGSRGESANAFIRQRRDDAQSFIRALEMRQSTLHRVMVAIVNRQKRFFMSGDPMDLVPMVLKDVANDTGYDVSVISRSTAGKYVSTPYGVFALRYFFNERHQNSEEHSSVQVMEAIKEMVEGENPQHPLTDRELTEGLAERGYAVARRTVAKYRERLGLPVGRLRKRRVVSGKQ